MKEKEVDLARELDILLEEYDLYKEADISFLLRQMLIKNHPRHSDYRKKADRVRQAYREGRLQKEKKGQTGLI